MTEELRIGHRGLEHREVDDTYWLNGTKIDDQVYNQELQRIIAYQQVTDQAKLIRELQAQAVSQAYSRSAQTLPKVQQRAAQASFVPLYGYAPFYPRSQFDEQHQTTEDRVASIPAGGGGALSIEALKEARAKAAEAERPTLSLKSTPLFGHLRWRFDSPFAPLHRWLIRWVWQFQRNHARTS